MWINLQNGKQWVRAFLAGIGFFFVLLSCAGPKARPLPVKHIVLNSLHFRRPENIGASVKAVPGDSDYLSQPLPDAVFDCKPFQDLFKDVNLAALRGCLWHIKSSASNPHLTYRLKREVKPFIELYDPDNTAPVCIKKLLKTISVPREIFFQSDDFNGEVGCYSARIPLSDEEMLRIPSRLHRFEVAVSLPPDPIPMNDEEMVHLLGTWVLLPFWDGNGKDLLSLVVPEQLCRKCMGEKNLIKKGETLPETWSGPASPTSNVE